MLNRRGRVTLDSVVTNFWSRYPRSVIVVRLLVVAWLIALTGFLLATGYWGWALLTIGGAVANFWLACRISAARRC